MPDQKISALTDGTTANATDAIPIARSGANYYITPGYIGTTLLGSSSLTGATVTTSQPVLNLSQTWNAGAVTFTGLKFNATDTASASGSLLLDLQVGGTSQVTIAKSGSVRTVADFTGYYSGTNRAFLAGGNLGGSMRGVAVDASSVIGFASGADANTPDTVISRAAAAALQLGKADAAAPVAQTLQVQSVVAGTTDTAGTAFNIGGSKSTGTGAAGVINIRTSSSAASTGTTQNALATVATFGPNTLTGSQTTPVLSLAQTWNTSGSPAGFSLAITDTASGQFSTLFTVGMTASTTAVTIGKNGSSSSLSVTGTNNGTSHWQITSSGYGLKSTGTFYWGSGNPWDSADLILARDAANTLALRNGNTAQFFRVYSTYTSSSVGAWVEIAATTDGFGGIFRNANGGATAGNLVIAGSGPGATGNLYFRPCYNVNGGWKIDTSGNLLAETDNSYDIGASGANRPRNVYVAGGVTTGSNCLFNGFVQIADAKAIYWSTRSAIESTADGDFLIRNNGSTGFGLLKFGGTSASFPALKRSSATLQVKLADDTDTAALLCGGFDATANPTVTISNASPGVVTLASHGLTTGQTVVFSTTGTLPTGLTAGTTYYVIATPGTTGTFTVATSLANALAGTAVNTSSAGSGTHRALLTTLDVVTTAGSQKVTQWGGRVSSRVAITGAYNVLVSDHIIEATGSSGVPTFPTAVGALGQMYIFKNNSGSSITPATTSSQTIDGSSPASLADKGVLRIYSDGANWQTW